MGNNQVFYAYEREDVPVVEALKPDEDCVCELYPGVDTVKKSFLRAVEKYGNEDFLGYRPVVRHEKKLNPKTNVEDEVPVYGDYIFKTYKEINQLVEPLSKSLFHKELYADVEEDGEHHRMIGIFARNSTEWIVTDLACACANITSVTLYDTLGAESTEYIIDQCELKTICLSRDKIKSLTNLKKAGKLNTLQNFIVLDKVTEEDEKLCEELEIKVYHFDTLIEEGKDITVKLPNPHRDSIYTICYTSGTTGDPKGVKLSHINLICPGAGLIKVDIQIYHSDVHLSYLPLAHVMERVVIVTLTGRGAKIGFYQGDVLKLKDDLAALKPTIFVSVPRLFNRFYDGMMAKINEQSGLKKKFANWAISRKLNNLEKSGSTESSMLDKLVFNKFRDAVGGNVRMMITGSAPIAKEVISFLKIAFSCPIYEGYGQTETAGGSCVTFSEDGEAGHVGGVLPQHELKLVDVPEMDYKSTDVDENGKPMPRGEICFKGHSNFLGYFKLPDKTAETIDSKGWIHTGDIGTILPNGALKIIDRKKNIFKLAQGEYIAPEKIRKFIQQTRHC